MGVCWGTVVAAELVAADRGVGSMIMIAKNFLQTDTVVIGIIIIGLIGYALEIAMRMLETWLIPWKGRVSDTYRVASPAAASSASRPPGTSPRGATRMS